MDTRHLRAFVKIAETGSISRAAESLGLSQPSLSQQLLRLEDEIGVTLFRRTARGVTLTDPGELFLDHARQLIRAAAVAVDDLREQAAEAPGSVVVALPPSLIRLAGARLIETFWREAPHIALRLDDAHSAAIRGWLEAGKIDLGLVFGTSPFRNLTVMPLASEELHLIGPAGRYAPGTDLPIATLVDLPLLLPGPEQGLRQVVEQAAHRAGIVLTVRMDLDAQWPMPGLIATHRLHTIAPLPAFEAEIAAGQLSSARIGGGAIRRRLALARHANRMVSHASLRAEVLIRQLLRDMIAEGVWDAALEGDEE